MGLAEPDGVEPPADRPVARRAWRMPTDRKVDLALELERAVRAATRGSSACAPPSGATGSGEGRWPPRPASPWPGDPTFCHLSVQALADRRRRDQDRLRRVGRPRARRRRPRRGGGRRGRPATRLLGAVQPASGRVTLVLEPRMAATLLGVVAGTLNGESVLKGRSPFADRVGEPIASPLLTLVDDPTDPLSLGADTHDGEGLATRRVPLIEGGVLQGFLHNTMTGRRAACRRPPRRCGATGRRPGSAPRPWRSPPAPGTLDDLVAGVDHGVLVQSMTGLHSGVNPVSGDFSVGVEGLMVRDGARAEPIREATMASTLQRLLLDVAVGGEREWTPGGTGAAALVIPGSRSAAPGGRLERPLRPPSRGGDPGAALTAARAVGLPVAPPVGEHRGPPAEGAGLDRTTGKRRDRVDPPRHRPGHHPGPLRVPARSRRRATSSWCRGCSGGTTSPATSRCEKTFDVALHLGHAGRRRGLLPPRHRAPVRAAPCEPGARRTGAWRGSSPSRRCRRRSPGRSSPTRSRRTPTRSGSSP